MLVGCEVVFCFDSGVNGIGKRRGGWRGYVGMEWRRYCELIMEDVLVASSSARDACL